jgi:predicted nucleotide-binding protein
MTPDERADAAIRAIEAAKEELEQIDQRLDSYDNEQERGNHRLALDRIHRWRDRTIRVITENVNGTEAMRLRAITNPVVVTTANLYEQYLDEYGHYKRVLVILLAALNEHPEDFFAEAPAQPTSTIAPPLAQARSVPTVVGAASNDARHRVFVVHGRNLGARAAVVQFLRCLGLQVIDWEQAVRLTRSSSPATLDVVSVGMAYARAIVVLLTPDEFGILHPDLADPGAQPDQGWQPRQNVIFEAGMALAIARERTILARLGRTREISDVAGINYVSLGNDPQSRQDFIQRLGAAGCAVSVSRDCFDIRIAGDFDACLPDLNVFTRRS